MNLKIKLALAIAAAVLLFLGSAAALGFVLWSGLAVEVRPQVAAALVERVDLIVFMALLISAGLGVAVNSLFEAYVVATQRLAEETRLIVSANPGHRIVPVGTAELQRLASEINALAGRYRLLEAGVEARVAKAHSDLGQEKNRLAALMSELAQSVLVCNIEGRMLLYNQRALQLLSTPAGADGGRNAAMAVGLGRSLFGVMDRNVVLHALEHIQECLKRGDIRPVAVFVTALAEGRLIRVQMAPVIAAGADQGSPAASAIGSTPIAGYVLTMEDIQRGVENASRRDRLLQSLTEGTRASLANIRAAIETMHAFPAMDAARRQRFEQVIQDEAQGLSQRLDSTITDHAGCVRAEWPLESMLARDLIAAVQRSIETRLGMSVGVEDNDQLVWLAVDSYSLVQALTYLAGRLKHERGAQRVRFRVQHPPRQAHAYLDLIWDGTPLAADTATQWQHAAIELGGEATPLTVDDIVERHNGQVWHQSDAAAGTALFRILLPHPSHLNAPIAVSTAPSRPEYYDFDLFHQPDQRPELDRCLLSELSYTVFDTETTGLEPSAGDEIISIGAIRIVNSRLLHGEVFDQLVDPARPLAAGSVRIHGIEPPMLAGQPQLERVLPRFHRFCEDTVLVAHNAAFDMRFLQMKEDATGVRFTQPVLDTLMLSAVVHPNQPEHKLEAIATRLGVNTIGRHTALGDAIMTGEIFLKLIPLLAAQGVRTLKDAREASQQTAYARLHY